MTAATLIRCRDGPAARACASAIVTTGSSSSYSTVDQTRSVLGDVAILRHDHRHGIADVGDASRAQAAALALTSAGVKKKVSSLTLNASRSSAVRPHERRADRAQPRCRSTRIVPRAMGLRTKATCSMPGTTMSSTNVPRPVSSRPSSLRAHTLADEHIDVRVRASRSCVAQPRHRVCAIGAANALIAGAATDVAGHRGNERVRIWLCSRPGGQRRQSHHDAGRAEAALQRIVLRAAPVALDATCRRTSTSPSTVVTSQPSA